MRFAYFYYKSLPPTSSVWRLTRPSVSPVPTAIYNVSNQEFIFDHQQIPIGITPVLRPPNLCSAESRSFCFSSSHPLILIFHSGNNTQVTTHSLHLISALTFVFSVRRMSHETVRAPCPVLYSARSCLRNYRVRCDLKDLPISPSGQHPACSNCKERNLKCV